ncbi:hypothetical protein Sbal175_1473 [Shewanella baltica BA175]|uniref:EpsG family protein n=1 Tax=Shewanella baltica TaxID=62322 RepID=UPI0001E4B7C6|nr:EpsG family protein [Shewanella baltica]AEG10749.1 hypothetical protein Sbal175_1473 [Shewanella baltica BA175]
MHFILVISVFYCFLLAVIKPKLYYIPWAIITFVAAFRFFVGPDFYNYYYIFDILNAANGKPIYIEQNGELLYVYLAKFIMAIGGQAQLQFAISAVLTSYFFYQGFKYLCRNNGLLFFTVSLLYLPFLYVASLNIVRQLIATAIFVFAIRYIIENRLYSYFFAIFIASLFHMSAVILFPLYWLLKWNVPKNVVFAIFLGIFVLIFFNPLSYISFLVANPAYAYYLTDPDYAADLGGLDRIFALCIIFFSFLCNLKLDKNNLINRIMANSLIIFSFITVCALHVYIFNRIGTYFKPALIMILSLAIITAVEKFKFDRTLIKMTATIVFMLLFTLVSVKKAMDYPSYAQFTFNFALFSDPVPLVVYGDLAAAQVN